MTTYSSVFGGQTVPPSEYKYRAISLTTDVTLAWPDNTDGTNLVAALMDITPTGGTWTITLPPANEVSSGRDFLMRNLGAVAFNVVDNASGALVTIAAGESRYFYITDNSTAAGSWSVFTYGTGTSSADASTLDGYGLTVLSGTLNSDMPISGIGTTYTISSSDRAQFLLYQGGTATWYWPDPTTLPNGFFCAVNNAGTGTLTIDANTAGGYIDEANTKTLQPGESCLVVNKGDATGCFTVGYGRSTEFAFTQLSVDVTGTGGITITSAQAANKLWYFYNTAGGDRTVTIPAVASVYFVRVGAIGAGNELTFTTGGGSTVALSANQSYTIYCDGTNVVSAQTVAVTSTVSLDDGSAAAPSLAFALDSDTGVYRAGTNELGIAVNGAMVATFGASGLTLATPLSVANGGTGRATSTTAYGLIAAGTTATGAHQTLPAGATTEILVGGGASALPAWTTATGSGAPVRATTPTLVTPILGTPTSGTLTNCTGLPVSTGVSGLGAGVADFLATPSSANLATAVTDETGSGALVFANTPTLVTPILGTPTSGTLTNCTGLPLSTGVTGTLPVGNGGTGQTTAETAFNALAPTTTKGDITAHTGTTNARVGVGTDGYVLTADSTVAPGLAWKDVVALGGLTLPVSVANGGTGNSTTEGAITTLSGSPAVKARMLASYYTGTVADGGSNEYVMRMLPAPTSEDSALIHNVVLGPGGTPAGFDLSWKTFKTVNSNSVIGAGDIAVQPTLVSGTNIKTVNSNSLLGAGDVAVQETLVSGTNIKTVNGSSILGAGDLVISTIPPIAYSARTANTMIGAADKGTLIDITANSFTQTFDTPATLGAGWWCYLKNSGTGDVRLGDATGTEKLTNGTLSAPTYGADVIVNGSFATDTNWTKGAGWTISGGTANASGATSQLLAAVAPLTTSKLYKVTFTVSAYSAGTVTPYCGGNGGSAVSANGTYTQYIWANNTSFYLVGGSFTGSIDNVSAEPMDAWVFDETGTQVAFDAANSEFDLASYSTTTPTSTGLRQTVSALTSGGVYELTYTVSNYSANGIVAKLTDGSTTQTFSTRTANGTYTELFIASAAHTTLAFDDNGSAATLSIKNISLKQASSSIDSHSGPVYMYPNEMRLLYCDGSAIRSIVINSFYKTFTASGTFFQPSGYSRTEGLLWGAGEAGIVAATNAAGGSAGACAPFAYQSVVAATITIGAGGATSGADGGDSTAVIYGPKAAAVTVLAEGGAGTSGSNSAYYSNIAFANSHVFGYPAAGNYAYLSGGVPHTSAGADAKQKSVYGGGAGGSVVSSAAQPAGTSIFGGDGGAAATGSNPGGAGVVPGGGGGATESGPVGPGARGECRIWGIK